VNALRTLWTSFANLANAVNALASTIGDANNRLRLQFDYEPPTTPALPHGGEVIDAEPVSNGRPRKAKSCGQAAAMLTGSPREREQNLMAHQVRRTPRSMIHR
jgi:hypothetical protein